MDIPPRWCPVCERHLPLTEFYRYRNGPRKGKPIPRCRQCRNDHVRHSGVKGYVMLSRIGWVLDELVARLGLERAANVVGVTDTTMRSYVRRRYRRLQVRHAQQAMLALKELRETNVWDPPRRGRRVLIEGRTKRERVK